VDTLRPTDLQETASDLRLEERKLVYANIFMTHEPFGLREHFPDAQTFFCSMNIFGLRIHFSAACIPGLTIIV
jgi:hypothetical protein